MFPDRDIGAVRFTPHVNTPLVRTRSRGSSLRTEGIRRPPTKCHQPAKDSQHSGVTVRGMRIVALALAAFLLAPVHTPVEDAAMIAVEGDGRSTGHGGADLRVRASRPNGPVENVYTSTWEGDALVTTITGPGMSRIERRSIEADGTMKVQTAITMMQGKPAPPGPGPSPMVLNRVK